MWLTFILPLDGTTLESFLHTAVRSILVKCQNFPLLRPESPKGFPAHLGEKPGCVVGPWPSLFLPPRVLCLPCPVCLRVFRSPGGPSPPRVCLWSGISSLHTLFPRWFQGSFLVSFRRLHEHPLSIVSSRERGPSWPPHLNQRLLTCTHSVWGGFTLKGSPLSVEWNPHCLVCLGVPLLSGYFQTLRHISHCSTL